MSSDVAASSSEESDEEVADEEVADEEVADEEVADNKGGTNGGPAKLPNVGSWEEESRRAKATPGLALSEIGEGDKGESESEGQADGEEGEKDGELEDKDGKKGKVVSKTGGQKIRKRATKKDVPKKEKYISPYTRFLQATLANAEFMPGHKNTDRMKGAAARWREEHPSCAGAGQKRKPAKAPVVVVGDESGEDAPPAKRRAGRGAPAAGKGAPGRAAAKKAAGEGMPARVPANGEGTPARKPARRAAGSSSKEPAGVSSKGLADVSMAAC